jgi:hypothetical protein
MGPAELADLRTIGRIRPHHDDALILEKPPRFPVGSPADPVVANRFGFRQVPSPGFMPWSYIVSIDVASEQERRFGLRRMRGAAGGLMNRRWQGSESSRHAAAIDNHLRTGHV